MINNLGIILKYERGGNLLSDSHNIFSSLESYFCHVFVWLATLHRPRCIPGNHWSKLVLPSLKCIGIKHQTSNFGMIQATSEISRSELEFSFDIFVSCNWVVTRWQYTFTHKQYIEQYKTFGIRKKCQQLRKFVMMVIYRVR